MEDSGKDIPKKLQSIMPNLLTMLHYFDTVLGHCPLSVLVIETYFIQWAPYICILFNYVSSGFGRKRSWPNLRYYPGTFLERLKKNTKNLSQDSWSLS
jgi:hypothetical protein